MKLMLHRGFRLKSSLMLAALASAPFIFVNSFFAPQVLAAPAIASITYISGTIPAPNAVYAREEVVFTANVTEGAGLVYVWSFGDGESAIGDAGNSGRVAHRYDRAFASVSFVTRPTLRLYSGTAEVASRSMDITVQVARLPANAASLSAAEQAALPDTWPFANITRADGPGPYPPGSTIDFRANESVRGTALSQWDASATFQWTILDASGVKAKEASVSIATEPTGGRRGRVCPGVRYEHARVQRGGRRARECAVFPFSRGSSHFYH
ncbi:MAG: PKD domain-containing protein [Parcubacteria group bacterium]|nr:PKD domain-containing protein [Parcubacteria group bacterium]